MRLDDSTEAERTYSLYPYPYPYPAFACLTLVTLDAVPATLSTAAAFESARAQSRHSYSWSLRFEYTRTSPFSPSIYLSISTSARRAYELFGVRINEICYLVAGWKSQGENRPGSRTACTWLHERAFRIVYFEIESCKTPGRKRLASNYADLKIERNDSSLKSSDLYFFIFILSFLRFCTK